MFVVAPQFWLVLQIKIKDDNCGYPSWLTTMVTESMVVISRWVIAADRSWKLRKAQLGSCDPMAHPSAPGTVLGVFITSWSPGAGHLGVIIVDCWGVEPLGGTIHATVEQ